MFHAKTADSLYKSKVPITSNSKRVSLNTSSSLKSITTFKNSPQSYTIVDRKLYSQHCEYGKNTYLLSR